jgi:hypothetical protein
LSLSVLGAKRVTARIHFAYEFLLIGGRKKRLTAHPTMNQIQRDHILPLPDQKMLKLDRLLWTDSPALTASGAFGHVVLERSSIGPIVVT